MSTLFVSDLDGTLLQPDARLSKQTVDMLNQAIGEGKLFTVATARTPATVAPILQDVNLDLPAVVMTGAALWHRDTDRYSNIKLFDPDVAKELFDIYRRTDTPTFVYSLNHDKIQIRNFGKISPLRRKFIQERISTPYKEILVNADGESDFPDVLDDVILFYTMLPKEQALATYGLTGNLPGVRAQYYIDIYGPEVGILEAFSHKATKARAIRELANMIGADKIVAFGDNINDLPMLREADVAVAVENALPEVKEIADIVIGPNTDNSVAKFILDH